MLKFKQFISETAIEEAIHYNIQNNIPLIESIFRYGSDNYFKYFNILRSLHQNNEITEELLTEELLDFLESDLGTFVEYEGEQVPLDFIMIDEEDTPELNVPKRGGTKKYIVYVKNPETGNIKKIQFGDTTGLTAKYNNPERKKAFAARHDCKNQNDKTSRAYWACRINRYLGKSPEARAGYW